jgi:hypothetical protein
MIDDATGAAHCISGGRKLSRDETAIRFDTVNIFDKHSTSFTKFYTRSQLS